MDTTPKHLSFVVSKTGNFNDSHKSEIYSHIARTTHQKRRRNQFRQSITRESSSSSSGSWKSTPQDDNAVQRYPRCTAHGENANGGCDQCSTILRKMKVSNTLLPYCGNSDPFSSQAIEIDARVNYYLDVGFNSIDNILLGTGLWAYHSPRGMVAARRTPADNWITSSFDVRLYGKPTQNPDVMQAQWSSTFAYAVLANYAGYLSSISDDPEHLENASVYVGKCMSGLRRYISQGYTHDHFRPESLIFRLLRAEIATHRFSTALIHAIYLKRLVESREGHGRLDLPFIFHGVYLTNQLAFALWTRPLFEPSWVESVFRIDWRLDKVFDATVFEERLSRYTKHGGLRKLLCATKGLFMQTSVSLTQNRDSRDDNWYWLQSRSEWLQMRLFHIVLAEEERMAFVSDQEITADDLLDRKEVVSALEAYVMAVNMNIYLALAAIMSIRFRQDPMLQGRPVSPVLRIILNKLSALFKAFGSTTVIGQLYTRYGDALLWIAYVAAVVEHRHREALMKQDTYGVCYKVLLDLIDLHRLRNWEELRECLEQFPFSEDETPLPSPGWLNVVFKSSAP